ncbi:hypothetical protein DD237_003109 [Peronospora effusa]|uniref:Uncharacterized protein n=1 Tax=Peronospora effusa TaxID=542832 RepID=A0A3R8CZX8_9STRA|nr:hypothetical protein DD237_003109 [Peronospora effusa]
MGVVFRPIDHHEASPELAPSNLMQCWGHKPQSTTTKTLTLTACPFLSLQDCIDKNLNMCWLSNDSKYRQLHVSVMTSTMAQQHSLKRWASVIITPHRGIKRQRISITRSYQVVNHETDQTKRAFVGSIKSLQYALPGLSSHDTLHVLHAMRVIPSELRYLNGNASRSHLKRRCKVRQIFGWRHLLCQENDDRRVVWKSAKALDSMKMRPLAHQIWKASTEAISGLDDRETGKVLYTVNDRARVVHSTKRQYGSRDQVWIECYLDDGLQVCVARKELRQFNEYRVSETSATECQGYLVRPMYTRAINARLVGCSLQCLRAVDARDCGVRSASALKQQMLDNLPQLTLQCEEDYIYDLVQTPQLLLDSVFAIKNSSDLLRSHADVDIIIQLASPSLVLRDACNMADVAELDRAQFDDHEGARKELVVARARLDAVEKTDLKHVLELHICV